MLGSVRAASGNRRRYSTDHDAVRNTVSTRRNARSLTNASTRSRVPSARSISITPGRSSIAGRGSGTWPGDDSATPAGDEPVTSPGPRSSGCPRHQSARTRGKDLPPSACSAAVAPQHQVGPQPQPSPVAVPTDASDRSGWCRCRAGAPGPVSGRPAPDTPQPPAHGTPRHARAAAHQQSRSVPLRLPLSQPQYTPCCRCFPCSQANQASLTLARRPPAHAYRHSP